MALPVCAWCEEPIEATDKATVGQNFVTHAECMARSVLGSLAHLKKTCSCYVAGSTESDPPELTKRQGARIAAIEAAIFNPPRCAPGADEPIEKRIRFSKKKP